MLSQAVVRTLRAEADLDDEARKFLAFSDNRQDASLQAGHFNDFVLVGLVRSALYRAALDHQDRRPRRTPDRRDPGTAGWSRHSVATSTTSPKTRPPPTSPCPRKKIARALRDVVTYRLWADLKRGWRITMPNLEQTGQLRLTYFGLDDLAAERRQVGRVRAAAGRRRTRDPRAT